MKTCAKCGKPLIKYQKKFCSPKCALDAARSSLGKCGICGKSFQRTGIPGNHFVVKKYGVKEVCPECRETRDLISSDYEMRCSRCGIIFRMPGATFKQSMIKAKKSGKESNHYCEYCWCHKKMNPKKNLVRYDEAQKIIARYLGKSSPEKKPLPECVYKKKSVPENTFGKSLKVDIPVCEVIKQW